MLWLYYRDEFIKRNINKENINMSKYKCCMCGQPGDTEDKC